MEERKNPIIIIILILAFIVSFLTCASFAFKVLISIPPDVGYIEAFFKHDFVMNDKVSSFPHSIIIYQMKYGDLYAGKFKAAWYLSGILHLCVFMILVKLFSKKQKLYGDARFATVKEIQKAGLFIEPKQTQKKGLFADDKIIVGKIGNRYIALGGQLFAYLAAPTRSGKGVGVVIPVGLSYDHSMVVSDIKQELFEITAAHRAESGHDIYLFDPFDPEGRTARWNPLSYIARTEEQRVDDLNQIAICLIPDSGSDDSFFEESARKLFLGLGLYCLDKENYWQKNGLVFVPTIKEILNLATDFSGDAIAHFSSIMQDNFVSTVASQTINSAVSAGDKTFASILATLTANLTPWLSKPVSDATSADDFDLREIRRKRMTIYLGIQPADLAKAGKIINLFYSQLINENTRTLPQNDPSLKYQCLMLMDEGTAAGRIAILEKAVSYMAGFNLRLLFIAQSPAQMEDRKVYGEHGTRNILTNIALKILYKPNDVKDSEEYSKLLGKITVSEDTSKSRGGGGRGVSRTESLQQRDLMMPQELREMSKEKEIILFEGLSHPIMASKNVYWQDPVFIARYKGKGKPIAEKIEDRLKKENPHHEVQEMAKKSVKTTINKYHADIRNGVKAASDEIGLTVMAVTNYASYVAQNILTEKATEA